MARPTPQLTLLALALVLAGSACAGRCSCPNIGKNEKAMKLIPMAELYENTRKNVLGTQLDTQHHQSFPIPLIHGGEPRVVYLYLISRIELNVGLMLLAPATMLRVDPRDGAFNQVEPFDPAAHGLPHKQHQRLGHLNKHKKPQLKPEEMLEQRRQFLAAMDTVLPSFYGAEDDPGRAVANAARTVKRLYLPVTEDLLARYHRTLAAPFLAWLDQVTR